LNSLIAFRYARKIVQLPLALEMVSISHFMPSSRPRQRVSTLGFELTFLGQCRTGLDVPLSVGHAGKLQVLHDLTGFKSQLQILFVCINQQWHLVQGLLRDQGL
jgi:hypothetical protein